MTQQLTNKILSDITVHMKYAKYLPGKGATRNMEGLGGAKQKNAFEKVSFS